MSVSMEERASTTSPELEGKVDVAKLFERVVQAEAARRAAEFKIDELEGKLLEQAEESSFAAREAELSGSLRGLRSRIAELEELRERAEGRLRLSEAELEASRERARGLEQEAMALAEQLELEFVKQQSAKLARPRQTADGEELALLRGELAGLRSRLGDREEALRGLMTGAALKKTSNAELRTSLDLSESQVNVLRKECLDLRAQLLTLEDKQAETLRVVREALLELQNENEGAASIPNFQNYEALRIEGVEPPST